jgi:hypothetical protein
MSVKINLEKSHGRVARYSEATKHFDIGHIFEAVAPATKKQPASVSYIITDPALPFFDWGSGKSIQQAVGSLMNGCKETNTIAFVEPEILNVIMKAAYAKQDQARN